MKYSENLNNSLVETATKVLNHTVQLFIFKENAPNTPYVQGCGLLFTFNSKFYFFSNAHVISDHNRGNTYFLFTGKKSKKSLSGRHFVLPLPPSGKRSDDKIDIAVIELDSSTTSAIKDQGYTFLDYDQVLVGAELKKDTKLFIAGYPGTATDVRKDKKGIYPIPLIHQTFPKFINLSSEGFSSNLHHQAKYSIGKIRDARSGNRKRGPQPHGISGSGLCGCCLNQ